MKMTLHEDYHFINTVQVASTSSQYRLDCIHNSCCDYYYSKLLTEMVPRPYVPRLSAFSRASHPPFLRLQLPRRFTHTYPRTLPEFSLEGKIAVGKSTTS